MYIQVISKEFRFIIHLVFFLSILTYVFESVCPSMQKPPRWSPWISTAESDLNSFLSSRNRFCDRFPSKHVRRKDSMKIVRPQPYIHCYTYLHGFNEHVHNLRVLLKPYQKIFHSLCLLLYNTKYKGNFVHP